MECFLHTKNTLKSMITKYIICLIPLYIYGIYKNGYLLYQKNIINLFSIFKVFYLILISLIIYIIINIVFKNKLKFDYEFLAIFIMPIFMPISISYISYILGLSISLVLEKVMSKFVSINYLSFKILTIYMFAYVFKCFEFRNILEINGIYKFSLMDNLWGRAVGGIATSSIIIGGIIFIILIVFKLIKKEIVIGGISMHFLLSLIFKNFSILINTFSIMALIFVSSDTVSSPMSRIGQITYGISIGILGFFVSKYITISSGILVSTLICSIFLYFISS